MSRYSHLVGSLIALLISTALLTSCVIFGYYAFGAALLLVCILFGASAWDELIRIRNRPRLRRPPFTE